MRDLDPDAPEIVAAGEVPAGHYGEVLVRREGETGRFRFGVTPAGHRVLQRVLAARPFDTMAGLAYRYVYAGRSAAGPEPIRHYLRVRVELGTQVRTLDFEAPAELVGALEWFRQLPAVAAAEHLAAPI